MFKRYVYTCPDVIHQRKVARNIQIANLAVLGVMMAAIGVGAWFEDRKTEKPDLEIVPDPED